MRVGDRKGSSTDFDDPEPAIREMRRGAWRALVAQLELSRFMSARAWRKLSDDIDKQEPPAITVENILALMREHHQKLMSGELQREAVAEVFDFLRPHSDYKTNKKFEIGRAVIISYGVEFWGFGKVKFHVNYRYQQDLTSLENVFHHMDGKGFVNKTWKSALAQAIETSETGHGETAFFKFKAYKNRNLHIIFKRPDLVRKLNAIAGGMNLKPRGWEEQ